jgi:tripartite-type tricarboxylate transporter receptor subunit TctC
MATRRDVIAACATMALAPELMVRAALKPARAQSPSASAWPNRYVRLIVPFAPGGGNDAVARILINKLSEIWGQQVIIENRGGAGASIGTEAAARSDPDGYTILFASLPHAINRFIYPSLSYDSINDFAPITQICHFPNLMAVPNSSPAKSVQEFITHAKANSGKINFASPGVGSSPHLCGELFKRMAGIEMTHVPYRGAGPALNDLIPGRIDMMFNTIGAMLPQARSGQVRGLAVTTVQRFPTAPEFPSVAEAGVPGFDVTAWYALFAPAKTPPEIVRKINIDAIAALRDPLVNKRLEDLGVLVVASKPEELAAFLQAEINKWGPIIKAANITAQ